MAKLLDDGRVDFNDDLTFEELELMRHWQGGQCCPLYALQSSGTLYRENIGSAITELERNQKHMENDDLEASVTLLETLNQAYAKFPPLED